MINERSIQDTKTLAVSIIKANLELLKPYCTDADYELILASTELYASLADVEYYDAEYYEANYKLQNAYAAFYDAAYDAAYELYNDAHEAAAVALDASSIITKLVCDDINILAEHLTKAAEFAPKIGLEIDLSCF